VDLDFGSLTDKDQNSITMTAVRKMRWTYAADLQAGAFQRSEFQVQVSNWAITGTNRAYSVAGPESVRIEDTEVAYTGTWTEESGELLRRHGSLDQYDQFGAKLRVSGDSRAYTVLGGLEDPE